MNGVNYKILCLNSLTAEEFEIYSQKLFKSKRFNERKVNKLFNLNIKKPDINAPIDVKLEYINNILEQQNYMIIQYKNIFIHLKFIELPT